MNTMTPCYVYVVYYYDLMFMCDVCYVCVVCYVLCVFGVRCVRSVFLGLVWRLFSLFSSGSLTLHGSTYIPI